MFNPTSVVACFITFTVIYFALCVLGVGYRTFFLRHCYRLSTASKQFFLDSATRASTLTIVYSCVRIAGIVRVCIIFLL